MTNEVVREFRYNRFVDRSEEYVRNDTAGLQIN